MWLTLVFIATVSAGDSDQVQCAEDLNERMALVLERLQEVQAQQEPTPTLAAPESAPETSTNPVQDDSSLSAQPAPVPPLEGDTSENDAIAESPV
jgi:hypothetical protein